MKKLTKSTLSLILALGMILSITACEKEEPTNDEPVEENAVPINWTLYIEYAKPNTSSPHIYETSTEMPENFFDYWYAELPKGKNRILRITLVFDYRYNFEDMPQEFQKQHNDVIQKYGGNIYNSTSEEETKSKNELRRFASKIAHETAENYYKSFEFQSSISPKLDVDIYWNNEIGFKYYEGNIVFKFMYDTFYSLDSHDCEASAFDTWEWHDKIVELAKIPGIKEVRIRIDESHEL